MRNILIAIMLISMITLSSAIIFYQLYGMIEKPNKPLQPIDKPIYHVKVERWSDRYEYYTIRFTNNDWLTSNEINEMIDVSYYDNEVNVNIQPILSKTPENLIEIARNLKTFDDCIRYNERVKKSANHQIQYRINNPIIGNPRNKQNSQNKFKTVEIY